MTIALPSSPLPASASPRPVLFGGPLLAEMGGEDQWLNRLGSKWELEVTTPRLKPEPDGRLWTEALARSWFTGERVSFPVPQPGLSIGAPGSVLVSGSNAGTVIGLKNATPGYVIRRGQYFSITTGGRRYLYRASADATVIGAGTAIVTFVPMLRVIHLDGDSVELVNPLIEGLLIGDDRQWTHARARTEPLRFTIRETR